MGWAGLTLVTDYDIEVHEPDSSTWGTSGVWSAQRTNAKRELKTWIEIAYPEVAGAADKVLDRWAAEYVFGYTGSAYSDITSAAGDDTEEDVVLSSVFATFGTDKLYVGASWEFDGLFVKLLDSFNANASTLSVKYHGPAGWTSLTIVDGTASTASTKAFSGTGRVTWTLPTNWERRRLNGTGDEYFWVELAVSAALTSGTAASQVATIKAPDGLKTVAQYLALMYVFKGLSAQAANAAYWLERAKDYEEKARNLFSILKDSGGIHIDTNDDDVIEPTIETAIPRPVRLLRG